MVISPPGFLMTDDAEDFAAFAHLADDLIVKASKDQLADAARLLELNIGYYQEKYGDVPQEELLRLVRAEDLDESLDESPHPVGKRGAIAQQTGAR